MIPDKVKARTPDARTPETLTLGAMLANLQFARGPVHVDLSAGRQMCSQAAAAVLPGDKDTDEDFTFMVTYGLFLQDALQQGNVLKWCQVIDCEVASLQYNQVFRQVHANQSSKVNPTYIILVVKRSDRGEVECHKVRLVAQRFFQRSSFDFDAEATYVLTVDLTILRLLLAKVASDDLAICVSTPAVTVVSSWCT